MRRDVPLRRSLLLKLLVLAALVSACSIAATAWLTVHTTAVAIRQEQGQALADDAEVYDSLLGYAATHHDWAGAAGTVRELARRTGHRITLTDENRHPLLDSAGDANTAGDANSAGDKEAPAGAGLPTEASATIDPLAVDASLVGQEPAAGPLVAPSVPAQSTPQAAPRSAPGSGAVSEPVPAETGVCAPGTRCLTEDQSASYGGRPPYPAPRGTIDSRAVGPFLLSAAERTELRSAAQRTAACLRDQLHVNAQVAQTPAGRSVVRTSQTGLYLPTGCETTLLDGVVPTEKRALDQLDGLVNTCLDRDGAPPVRLNLDYSWDWQLDLTKTTSEQIRPTAKDVAFVGPCVNTGRAEQLAPYVAPPALLFVSSPRRTAATFLDLSAGNRARIAEVTGLVLLGTLAVTALLGTRMIRPLRALAGAARRMTDGDLTTRVKVRAGDEIGSVAAAFNTMSERREQSEGLRKAMVSDVAHELRTPLSNIRGWLEAAQDGLVVPDRQLVGSLLDEAVLLQHVIDDLRDLSAADAGELRLHTEPVDVADLLDQVATAHRGHADAAGVTLLTSTDGRPVSEADPVRLRQAVGNLVSNAVRHTPPGGTVTLRARTEDARTEGAGAEGARTEGARTEGAGAEGARTEGARTEGAGAEGARTQDVGTPGARTQAAGPESARTEGAGRQSAGSDIRTDRSGTERAGASRARRERGGGEGGRTPRTVIDIVDTGSGIGPDELPRVFDRFWRAEKSRSRQTGGSGLGLSIVRKLAEAHGGTATATSVPGRGSVFTITLPEGPGGPGDDPAVGSATPSAGGPGPV